MIPKIDKTLTKQSDENDSSPVKNTNQYPTKPLSGSRAGS